MDYNDVPLFIRIVEAGSFSKAATALGLQKSTVSRNVARLEDDLGVGLLQRTTRQLALTEAGKTFYERVRAAVAGLDEAAGTARTSAASRVERCAVSAPPDADSDSIGIATAVARFVERYPKGIHVEMSLEGPGGFVAEGFDSGRPSGPPRGLLTHRPQGRNLVLRGLRVPRLPEKPWDTETSRRSGLARSACCSRRMAADPLGR